MTDTANNATLEEIEMEIGEVSKIMESLDARKYPNLQDRM